MNKFILSFAVVILSASVLAYADDSGQQVITLKDGSQIKGVLSGIDNGVYTVKTPIIGDVHVAANDVASITSGDVPAPVAAPTAALPTNTTPTTAAVGTPTDMNQQIAATQQQLMANPQNMQMLTQMAQDPQVMQALQDPAVVQAVQNHDYQALQSNPAIQKLMSNPQMQALVQKMAAQQQQQAAPAQ